MRGEHIGSCQNACALLDHWRGGSVSHRIEVPLYRGPVVLAVFDKKRRRVDGAQGCLTSSRVPSLPIWPEIRCVHGYESAVAGASMYPGTSPVRLRLYTGTQPEFTMVQRAADRAPLTHRAESGHERDRFPG